MSHRTLIRAACCVALVAATATVHAQREREITVEVGEQTSISAEGVRSYSEGTRGIVDVRLTSDQSRFILVGVQPGRTSLLMIMRDGSQVQYRITVPGGTEEVPEGRIEEKETIRLDLYFVQLVDRYSHAIGIRFPDSIGGGGQQQSIAAINTQWVQGEGGAQTSINLTSSSILPRLDIAQSNGWSRIYRQASVVAVNGQQAQVNVGGEVNFLVPGNVGGSIETIEFGTILTCTPRYDPDSGRLEIQINADVSDLTDDGGSGVPGRNVSTLSTLVNMELGQSVVLGGVIARSGQRSRDGFPGLSQIPVLGALFGSHSRRWEESETLLFIIPTIVQGIPLQQRNRIQEAIRIYEDFRGGVAEVELVEQPRPPGARLRTNTAEDESSDED